MALYHKGSRVSLFVESLLNLTIDEHLLLVMRSSSTKKHDLSYPEHAASL